MFDTWYESIEYIKFIIFLKMDFFKQDWNCNRHINHEKTRKMPVKEIDFLEKGDVVHLKGYGMIKVFKNVRTDDYFEYLATNDLTMNHMIRLKYAEMS